MSSRNPLTHRLYCQIDQASELEEALGLTPSAIYIPLPPTLHRRIHPPHLLPRHLLIHALMLAIEVEQPIRIDGTPSTRA